MRIALAQMNPTVGDVPGNTARLVEAIERAHEDSADLLITSELAVLGYPPRDLLFREGVVEACEQAVREIAEAADEMTVIVGHPRRCEDGRRGLRNSASICRAGRVIQVYDKRLLPGYDVFDEDRYFDPGDEICAIDVAGAKIGVIICEDLWRAQDVSARSTYTTEPVRELVQARCTAIVALNASPFIVGKFAKHCEQLQRIALEHRLPIVSVNQAGANDDLIFDGRSVFVDASGRVRRVLPGFDAAVETVSIDDSPSTEKAEPCRTKPLREIFDALVLGVRDYCRKTGHERVHIGLSGGIDSALTAAIAAAALGPEHVKTAIMPSRYSSKGSVDDSLALIENLGLSEPARVSIADHHDLMLKSLRDTLGDVKESLTDQNVQARLRGLVLMALSNATGSLVLSTSNKSEIAAGYSTLYGDMCGAISVLGDLTKTRVYELARFINQHWNALGYARPPIPEASITKPPSAELLPNQTDQDTLPPYDVLDAIIVRYIDEEQSPERIIEETGFDPELVESVTRLIDRAEYKRNQASVILKVTPRAFGPGRVMPIVMKGLPARVRSKV